MTGPELKARRTELGLTLRDVADALGITHIQQVSEWERGDVRPGSKHLAKLAEVLGLEIANLLPAPTTSRQRSPTMRTCALNAFVTK